MSETLCTCNHGDHSIVLCPLHTAAPALADAAFHAWVTLGELLLDFSETRREYKVARTELQAAYDALGEALEQSRAARRARKETR